MTGADVDTISQALAGKIKNYRKISKLSLDELSRRAGISKGMLVEIEKGSANPSIGILCKLSAALGLSVADLVNVSSEPAVHLIDAPEIPTLWHGPLGGTARLLAGTTGPDMIELWQWEMAPGERFDSDGHTTGTVELFHVEQGILTIGIDGEQWQVKAGQSLVARTDVPHHYANSAETPLRFTMTVAELTAR
ncbi:helix-turn-helix domain-containing protein [Aeromonas sp. RU39B]|uniref:helix-turn-helix domain-containing protein n=1 Tax=Aeromonas sp. RU39B TaxID=1907416 RepID=UPI0021163121|nr:helix-turn-helix domain-containing protein [Aeromonas sp. RU39B]